MKKLRKKAISFTQAGVTMGVGGSILGRVGGGIATSGQAGLSRMSGFMPVTGRILGAGTVLGELGKIGKRKKK